LYVNFDLKIILCAFSNYDIRVEKKILSFTIYSDIENRLDMYRKQVIVVKAKLLFFLLRYVQ